MSIASAFNRSLEQARTKSWQDISEGRLSDSFESLLITHTNHLFLLPSSPKRGHFIALTEGFAIASVRVFFLFKSNQMRSKSATISAHVHDQKASSTTKSKRSSQKTTISSKMKALLRAWLGARSPGT